MKLFGEALAKFFCGFLLVGALVFWPAGTLAFGKGWLLMGLLFGPMFAAGLVMLKKAPDFLAKRLDAKEKQAAQKGVLKLAGLMFVGGFAVAGLDYRFGWSRMPLWVTVAASVVFLGSYLLYAEVMRENAWLSRTIRVEEGQQVVSTGLYGIVRHPMYMATLALFLSMPLVLGSWWAVLIFCAYPVLIVVRLKDEEELLTKELPGYEAYKEKVRYRLIPFVW